jgi:hypothetical protein
MLLFRLWSGSWSLSLPAEGVQGGSVFRCLHPLHPLLLRSAAGLGRCLTGNDRPPSRPYLDRHDAALRPRYRRAPARRVNAVGEMLKPRLSLVGGNDAATGT